MYLFRTASLALFLALPASALADHGTCPGTGPLEVQAKMTAVIVNGLYYDIKGPADRQAFAAILSDCGATEAETQFERWRNARIATNATAYARVAVDSPLLLRSHPRGLPAGGHNKGLRRQGTKEEKEHRQVAELSQVMGRGQEGRRGDRTDNRRRPLLHRLRPPNKLQQPPRAPEPTRLVRP